MASPVSIRLDELKILDAFRDRLLRRGLTAADVQPSIDDPVLLERVITPLMMHPVSPDRVFQEPPSHQQAREILGADFHGVAVVEKYFGAFTDEERRRRTPLRLWDGSQHLLSEKRTLEVVEECTGSHVLCAVPDLDLLALYVRQSQHFCDLDRSVFWSRDQRKLWSGKKPTDCWVLARRSILPGSKDKSLAEQQDHLKNRYPEERMLMPAEAAAVSICHFLETREKLGDEDGVRFQVETNGPPILMRRHYNNPELSFYTDPTEKSSKIGILSKRVEG